jgi:diacylglycerol O-acyltransferase
MVGFMLLSLCSDIADPRERLEAIHHKSVEAKAYAQALGPRIALDISDLIPGSVLSVALRAATLSGLAENTVIMNTVVTNVPGPPFAQYLCGAELIRNLSLGPLFTGVGLFHVIYSTVQHGERTITLSVNACRQMMPDPEFYAECLQAAHDELAFALLGTRRKRGTGKRKQAGNKAPARRKAAARRGKKAAGGGKRAAAGGEKAAASRKAAAARGKQA